MPEHRNAVTTQKHLEAPLGLSTTRIAQIQQINATGYMPFINSRSSPTLLGISFPLCSIA